MAISTSITDDGKTLLVRLPEQFDFDTHKEFRSTHKNVVEGMQVVVDFTKTKHLDSSALGMLLLMREELGEEKSNIKFINCHPNIKSLLEMASFDKLFLIA